MVDSRGINLFIDPFSRHFYHDALFDANSLLNRDGSLGPYIYLREWLTQRGIAVHTADYLFRNEIPDAKNLYVSLGIWEHYRGLAKRGNIELLAFFAVECPIVEPLLYRELKDAQHYFKHIFTTSDSASLERFTDGPIRCESFRYPIPYEDVDAATWKQTERKFLTMINTNRLPRLNWQELYTERLRAVEYFARFGEIDLYGTGWNEPSFKSGKALMPATIQRLYRQWLRYWDRLRPNPLLVAARRVYRGSIASKAETLGRYNFAICFENSILPGWITEKIFDCLHAGTIPIYWGAPDIQEFVPSNCFIDMRQFANYTELRDHLKSLTAKEIQGYRENARDYLRSPKFRPFTKQAFVEIFARLVAEETGASIA
jgi:hypothetical protein